MASCTCLTGQDVGLTASGIIQTDPNCTQHNHPETAYGHQGE